MDLELSSLIHSAKRTQRELEVILELLKNQDKKFLREVQKTLKIEIGRVTTIGSLGILRDISSEILIDILHGNQGKMYERLNAWEWNRKKYSIIKELQYRGFIVEEPEKFNSPSFAIKIYREVDLP